MTTRQVADERAVSARDLAALALPSALCVLLTNGYRVVDQYYGKH